MNDVIIVYDKEGRYIRIAPTNPSRLFNRQKTCLEKGGGHPAQTYGAPYYDGHPQGINQRADGQTGVSLEIEHQEYWFEGNISKLNEEQVFLVARDITDRKYNELLQSAITQITEAALSAPDITSLLKVIHENIRTLMPADNFYISLYDEAPT